MNDQPVQPQVGNSGDKSLTDPQNLGINSLDSVSVGNNPMDQQLQTPLGENTEPVTDWNSPQIVTPIVGMPQNNPVTETAPTFAAISNTPSFGAVTDQPIPQTIDQYQPQQSLAQQPIGLFPDSSQTALPRNAFVTEEVSDAPVSSVFPMEASTQSQNSFNQANLSETIPPVESLPEASVDMGVSPPPAPQPETGVVGGSISDSGKKNVLKPILIGVGILLLISIIGFAVFKFVLPMLGGKTPVSNKEVTLTWWGLWEDQSVISPIISEYQSAHPNVKINYVKQSQQDYRERVTNALAKGSGPDIFSLHNSWLPMFKNDLDVVPNDVVILENFSSSYYPVMATDLEIGGNLYGIPREYDGLAMYVNEELFETAGKSIPTTWDEVREAARALTIKDENGVIQQAGIAMGRTENVDHWQEILGLLMIQNNVKLANPTGKNAEDALSFFTIFSSVDGVWDQTLPPSTIAFSGGKVAMYIGSSWRAFEIKEQNPKLIFKVVTVPQLAKASPTDPDITYATYWVDGVAKRSQNKDQSWEFLKYLSSTETLQKMYMQAAKVRAFGQPYPKLEMASLLATDPIVSAFIRTAPNAKSWYLQSRTFDGPTGINSQINKYFEDAINSVNAGSQPKTALETVAKGVNQVLSNYGLATATTQVPQ